jgi:hypothetical protein
MGDGGEEQIAGESRIYLIQNSGKMRYHHYGREVSTNAEGSKRVFAISQAQKERKEG